MAQRKMGGLRLIPDDNGSLRTAVAAALIDIEAELRALQLWETRPPPPQALASTQPFAIDTLSLPQWLQFIFLPRMHHLVSGDAALPSQCGITPIAEEYFRGSSLHVVPLLRALGAVDALLTTGS
jgi:uncharacterized protein YqcC (DUF446 family)